ncbi:non-hydrolyzing UDP-N-acetylglucosamine 2-epimerase [Bosea minatitlanensis]|uniref:UDP-N-acetylglucosamine 2-epimerase (non-hydrolyzing) n=1 Tax=Bosea minatitlanensis TaxID=128782 RepID=A0ABW0FBU0_9HYPH|nr:UDP-N-acetylglucosamine 2-epimerase (non-hydrolyzing) [Bosea minatitlanensis]
MARRKRLLVVMGTRPEAIKLAPLILAAGADAGRFEVLAVRTSQHREMLDQVVGFFGLPILADLDVMRRDQGLAQVTTAILGKLQRLLADVRPDVVVVQGDTTTSFVGALAAFYENVPVAHVEAGLRTYDKRAPFPEEVNRRLISVIADYHFAPTETARLNLLKENVPAETIWVTGNTAIDALLLTLARAAPAAAAPPAPTLLLTTHRRENQGEPMRRICEAVLILLKAFPQLRVVCPMHLSPRVRQVVGPMLGAHPRVSLIEPLGYEAFVLAMNRAHIILSDSGGVQEEAPALGKPVLVLRDSTERPEAVEAGTARLVGTEVGAIVSACRELLTDPAAYRAMAQARNPFGDGHASEQILDVLARSPGESEWRGAAAGTAQAAALPAQAVLQAVIAAEAARSPASLPGVEPA